MNHGIQWVSFTGIYEPTWARAVAAVTVAVFTLVMLIVLSSTHSVVSPIVQGFTRFGIVTSSIISII
jgi:hypothetical protein